MKQTVKTTVFLEIKKDNIIMLKDVRKVDMNERAGMLYIYVNRENNVGIYAFPLVDVLWYEIKTSNFVEIKEEGGDA